MTSKKIKYSPVAVNESQDPLPARRDGTQIPLSIGGLYAAATTDTINVASPEYRNNNPRAKAPRPPMLKFRDSCDPKALCCCWALWLDYFCQSFQDGIKALAMLALFAGVQPTLPTPSCCAHREGALHFADSPCGCPFGTLSIALAAAC